MGLTSPQCKSSNGSAFSAATKNTQPLQRAGLWLSNESQNQDFFKPFPLSRSGQVMLSHHSDEMTQRLQIPWYCQLPSWANYNIGGETSILWQLAKNEGRQRRHLRECLDFPGVDMIWIEMMWSGDEHCTDVLLLFYCKADFRIVIYQSGREAL